MARIHEEVVLIKMSKLVRNSGDTEVVLPEGFAEAVEAFVDDLMGDSSIIVEVVGTDDT